MILILQVLHNNITWTVYAYVRGSHRSGWLKCHSVARASTLAMCLFLILVRCYFFAFSFASFCYWFNIQSQPFSVLRMIWKWILFVDMSFNLLLCNGISWWSVGLKIYQWNGKASSGQERVKGAQVLAAFVFFLCIYLCLVSPLHTSLYHLLSAIEEHFPLVYHWNNILCAAVTCNWWWAQRPASSDCS